MQTYSAEHFERNDTGARVEQLIQHYGRSWGDACGGSRLLVEPFFNSTRCYSLAIPSTDCILPHDLPAMPSHIPCDYKFTFKEKRKSPSGHLLYIWAAMAPPTACANSAYLSAYRAAARASESKAKVLHLLALLVQKYKY